MYGTILVTNKVQERDIDQRFCDLEAGLIKTIQRYIESQDWLEIASQKNDANDYILWGGQAV